MLANAWLLSFLKKVKAKWLRHRLFVKKLAEDAFRFLVAWRQRKQRIRLCCFAPGRWQHRWKSLRNDWSVRAWVRLTLKPVSAQRYMVLPLCQSSWSCTTRFSARCQYLPWAATWCFWWHCSPCFRQLWLCRVLPLSHWRSVWLLTPTCWLTNVFVKNCAKDDRLSRQLAKALKELLQPFWTQTSQVWLPVLPFWFLAPVLWEGLPLCTA